MKRLSGGLILLNLTNISLDLTGGETTITDESVLQELTELRSFIDINQDFSKGFKNLKPVYIEYRSSASKFNGVALANLNFHTDALHLNIGCLVNNNGKYLNLIINVVYEWDSFIGYKVKTAKLNAYEKTAMTGANITGDVDVVGDVDITGDVDIVGDVKIFENIVDSDGHKRFIDGNINPIEVTGITHQYAKWSLSGTHLMIVDAIKVADESTITAYSVIGEITIPEWMGTKIYPIGTGDWVVVKNVTASDYDGADTLVTTSFMLRKVSNTSLTIYCLDTITATQDLYFRFSTDLLIDNE